MRREQPVHLPAYGRIVAAGAQQVRVAIGRRDRERALENRAHAPPLVRTERNGHSEGDLRDRASGSRSRVPTNVFPCYTV